MAKHSYANLYIYFIISQSFKPFTHLHYQAPPLFNNFDYFSCIIFLITLSVKPIVIRILLFLLLIFDAASYSIVADSLSKNCHNSKRQHLQKVTPFAPLLDVGFLKELTHHIFFKGLNFRTIGKFEYQASIRYQSFLELSLSSFRLHKN